MRNSKTKRNAIVNVARLMILVLAFTLTFALVLGLSLTGGFGGDSILSNGDNVAEAADSGQNDRADSFGTANPTYTAKGELNATHFVFPGTTANKTEWALTDTLNNFKTSTTNFEMYKTGGNTKMQIHENTDAGTIRFGIDSARNDLTMSGIVNIKISPFLEQLLDQGFEVTAKFTSDFSSIECGSSYIGAGDQKAYYYTGAVASSDQKNAEYGYNNKGNSFWDTNSKDWSKSDVSTSEVTLDKNNKHLAVFFVVRVAKQTVGRQCYLTVSNIRVNFTIKYKNSNSITNDGGNPVKVSEVYGNANTVHSPNVSFSSTKGYEVYTPYRTIVQSSVNNNTMSKVWPLYYSSIVDDLKNAVDVRDNNTGNWTLNSYESDPKTAAIGSSNKSITYYKGAIIDFADTYNYTNGTTSSTDLNATNYKNSSSTYRNTAGMGGYSISGSTITAESNANSIWTKVCGIKTVTVSAGDSAGAVTIDVTSITASNTGSVSTTNKCAYKELKVNGRVVGYAVVGRFNRARIRLELYMVENADVTVQVLDFGSGNGQGKCTSVTKFNGIDSTAPDGNTSIEMQNYVVANTNNLTTTSTKWFRQELFAPSVGGNQSTSGTPYVWFYTVQRADTITGLGTAPTFENYAEIKSKGAMLPIGYGNMTTFEYDFLNGGAKGYGGGTVGNPQNYTDSNNPDGVRALAMYNYSGSVSSYMPSGAGYYRFNFYLVDAAGNLRNTVDSYYVKVDFSDINGETNLGYTYGDKDENGNLVYTTISPNQFDYSAGVDGLVWSTAETRFTFTISNVSFSGNTLAFFSGQTGNTAHYLYLDRDGNMSLSGGSPTYDEANKRYTLRITTSLGSNDIYITYKVVKKGQLDNELTGEFESYQIKSYEGVVTIEFEGATDGVYPDVAWISKFTAYAGKYTSTNELENDSEKISWFNSLWGKDKDGEISILIDRNVPDAPLITTSGDYLVKDVVYDFDSIVRNWYSSYTMSAKLDTIENIANNATYGAGVRVYRGIKHIANAADLATLGAYNIEDHYQDINKNNINNYQGWFDNFDDFLFSDWAKGFDLTLLETSGSGMRVLYVWIVDQAGQISPLTTYYVLADNSTYTVNNKVFENPAFGDTTTATILQGKDVGGSVQNNVTSFRRGETVSFTFNVKQGYVPYLFTMSKGSETVTMLENYSAAKTLTASNGFATVGDIQTGIVNGNDVYDSYTVTVMLDDLNDLGRLDTTINFELKNRYVVVYQYNSLPVTYTALPAVVTVMNLNDNGALDHFRFHFVDNQTDNNLLYATTDGGFTIDKDANNVVIDEATGEPKLFHAVNAGTYYVRVFIPREDDTYVTDDYDFDADGMQVFSPEVFIINKGVITVTPTATNSIYGEEIELAYTTSVTNDVNIDNDKERLTGSLKLDLRGSTSKLVGVGSYEIVEDGENPFAISDNFVITVTSGIFHEVRAREVQITAWNATKSYGNQNPTFLFGVDESQFGWYLANGNDFTLEEILGDVFGRYTEAGEEDGYKLYNASNNLISCSATRLSDVGNYPLTADAQAFSTASNNFTINISTEDKVLTITQRSVVISASGERVVANLNSFDPSTVRPDYTIDVAKDQYVQAQIDALLVGKLSLASTPMDYGDAPIPDDYSDMAWYQILLGAIENANISITLADGAIFKVYVASADAIIIGTVDGAVFSLPFGTVFTNDLITFAKFASNFTVSGIEPDEFDSIEWSFDIANATLGNVISTGGHAVTIDNDSIKLYKGGVELNRQAYASGFNLTISPSTIIVRPVVNAADGYQPYHKVYGDLDTVFGFDFEIVGVQMGDDIVEVTRGFAGYSYDQLYNAVDGKYVRAMFAADGTRIRAGYTNDFATDANGNVLSALGATTDYYSFEVGTEFSSSDSNFNVEAQLDTEARLFIDPKAINLDLRNFVGVSKTYDGNTIVKYGENVTVYDLSNQMVTTSDSVKLTFNAEYTTAGSLTVPTEAGIRFTNFAFDVENSVNVFNYRLGTVVNGYEVGDEGELFDENDNMIGLGEAIAITDGVSLIIYYINSIDKEHIQIFTGKLGITQSDFTVSKVYDNTSTLTLDHITIAENEDEDGYGTTVLVNAINNGNAQLFVNNDPVNSIVFGDKDGDKDAGNYIVGNIKIFFAIEGASGLDINTEGKYDPNISRVSVEATYEDGVEGVMIEIRNMVATITPRILTADSFEEISTVNRDYNGTARVYTEFIYKDDVLAEGDTTSSVGLRLIAQIAADDESVENYIKYGVGEHSVRFAEYSDKSIVDAPDNTTISNRNYAIDIDSLNERFALDVTISKAKLTPNVTFLDKVYSGDTSVDMEEVKDDEDQFTVVGSADTLADELATFSLKGELTFNLSALGVLDENVAVDKDGNVIAHNVMVGGMGIVENSGDKNYLRNYELNGYVYKDGKYVTVEKAYGELESGKDIDDYEILDALTVNKLAILIRANNVIIEEKIYDGTRNANVTISLENSGVVAGHEKLLTITASGLFARNIVNDNVPVSIFDVELSAIDSEGLKVINNYSLSEYTASRTASILPRPVAVTASLGEKVYNGLAAISNNQMTFTLDGILDSEYSGYAVQASGGAYYYDKNVAVKLNEKGEVIDILTKPGTVYNPILRNNRGKVNYTLVYASDKLVGEDYVAYTDVNGVWHYGHKVEPQGEVTYYYALPTADRFIAANDTEKLTAAKDYIAGYYNRDGIGVYVVDSKYEGETTGALNEAVSYIKGEGKILQRSISIARSGIVINPDSTAFTKMYDGTSYFFGKQLDKTNPSADWDYYFKEDGILGLVNNDNVELAEVEAHFDTAYTTANYVIFTPTGIKGSDVHNYCIDGTIASARYNAKIEKRTIDAYLSDGVMEYGTPASTVVGEITYKVHGNDTKLYNLNLCEGAFYLQYGNYKEMMGFGIGNFQDSLLSRIFMENSSGGFDLTSFEGMSKEEIEKEVDSNPMEYFIKLSGITALPTAKAQFTSTLPSAGSAAASYTLANVNVNNYKFNPVYTKGDTSVLTVQKKDIFVATDGSTYVKSYGGNNPMVEVYYVDKNGNPGFVSPDNAITVFRQGSTDFYPVVKFGVYDAETNKVTPIEKYPLITEDLKKLNANLKYVIYFELPEGADYEELIPNYNIHLGDSYDVNDDGILVLRYGDFELKTGVSELEIKRPELSGMTLRGAIDNAFNATYDGTNLTSSVVLGAIREGDMLYIGSDEPVDVGTYNGIVKVSRPVKVDENDTRGYCAEWTSADSVTLTINPASPQLTVFGGTKNYDGKAFEYGVSGANSMIDVKSNSGITVLDEYADIKYEQLVDGKYVEVEKMINAGVYRVSVTLNDEFAKANRNYASETATAQYTIMRATVNVSITSSDDYKINNASENLLGAVYEEGKQYNINYTMSMNADVPEDIVLPKDKTQIVFSKDITSPGIYKFDVEIVDSRDNQFDRNNYNIVGAKGTLELTTNFVLTYNGASSVTLSTQTVANKFEAKEIIDGRGSAFDLDYWTKVEAYMPHISSDASLAAVVRTTLYYGDSVVNVPNGTSMAVSVALPNEVGNMDGIAVYYVTRDGGLERLQNYQIKDGKIEYTTDYLSALVFVDVNPNGLPLWAIIAISVTCGIVGIALIWTLVALVIRKRQLKKM